jgi:uncharacterized protein
MNRNLKQSVWFSAALLGCLVLTPSAQAASFDCGKASTKVEKLVCDTPAISKLDNELDKFYQDVLGKANGEQKKLLITEQKHWLKHSRNECKDETCLKLAYWSRQSELVTFFESHSPLYEHESDKTEAIKQVLAKAPLYPISDTPFCRQIFDDLKQMKDVRFVDPVVQTLSYEDPALEPWTKQCQGKPPIHFSYGCDPNISGDIRGYKDAMETSGCSKGFGLPPFKIYELPVAGAPGKKQNIIYSDDAYGGNAWEYNDVYRDVWEFKKPQLGGGGSAGFQAIDAASCKRENGFFADAGQGGRNGENYNSIIEYKNQYYFLVLHHKRNNYWLEIQSVMHNGSKDMKVCDWTPVAPESNSSTQGRK